MPMCLLQGDELPPVLEYRRNGRSPFMIAVDHAGNRVPRRLRSLGLTSAQLAGHIAWDIGALEVAREMSKILDAPLVAQNYSRLVIDCNRRFEDPTSIPVFSASVQIPGNVALTKEEIEARQQEIFQRYHDHLDHLLEERHKRRQRTILVIQHSMTDVFNGVRRRMHAAVLYNRDDDFARLVLDLLRQQPNLIVGENEPYSARETAGYTLPHHGERRGIPHVEIEIRQDLIGTDAGQKEWGGRLAGILLEAERRYPNTA